MPLPRPAEPPLGSDVLPLLLLEEDELPLLLLEEDELPEVVVVTGVGLESGSVS